MRRSQPLARPPHWKFQFVRFGEALNHCPNAASAKFCRDERKALHRCAQFVGDFLRQNVGRNVQIGVFEALVFDPENVEVFLVARPDFFGFKGARAAFGVGLAPGLAAFVAISLWKSREQVTCFRGKVGLFRRLFARSMAVESRY